MNEPPFDQDTKLLQPVAKLFDRSMQVFGANHKAVAWRDPIRQFRRFQVFSGLMTSVEDAAGHTSVNDLGCGYGAMFQAFADLPPLKNGKYIGYDISEEMLSAARKRIRDLRASFIHSHIATEEADYSFVSGTYNMKLDADDDPWREYIEDNLIQLWSKSKRALGFNMLSSLNPRREQTLYYADPEHFTEFCRRNISPNLRRIDTMAPDEWTIFMMR